MQTESQPRSVSKVAIIFGSFISALVVGLMSFSAVMKLLKSEDVVEGFQHLELDHRFALALGITELACAVIYVIPRTAVLGAILLTGYLGGAILTHMRIYEPIFGQIFIGVLVWLGLYLRDRRVRALIPFRSQS